MKPMHVKQNETSDKKPSPLSAKVTDNQDTRYDYLMLLTNEWIASQKLNHDFIRSIN